ncbi:hypothetical protein [Flagellimonas sp.]|uniref:hypothetical protein n=1 Tax=Flagellimonas sp. TaxID=2058762 RepID=UPI003B51CB50
MNLNFKFKGDRDYVHGTDIYTRLVEVLKQEYEPLEMLELSFHKVANKQLKMLVLEQEDNSLGFSNQACIFKFNHKGQKYLVGLSETDENVKERYDYVESEIEQMAVIHAQEKRIGLAPKDKFSNIELVVAMNKILLSHILPDPGKWYFARLQVSEDVNPIKASNIEIQLIKNIGSKITKSSIAFDGEIIGNIFFSKVPQQ